MTMLVVRRGETLRRQFQLLDENGSPQDLTGMQIEAQVRPWEGGPLWATFGSTLIASQGIVNLVLSAAQTRKFKGPIALWDAWLVSADGGRTLIDEGKVAVRQSPTASGSAMRIRFPSWGDVRRRSWGEAKLSNWGNS